jgi:hypothetical protein
VKRVVAASVVVILAACGPLSPEELAEMGIRPTPVTAVCSDTAYQRMKRTPIDSMSAREFEVFKVRDAACLNAAVQATRDSLTMAQAENQSSNGTALALLALVTTGILVYLLAKR